jgi:hypothetical protein
MTEAKEFPPELIERCRKAAYSEDMWNNCIRAILRESGHAELVAALEEYVRWDIPGMTLARQNARAALLQAGAAPRDWGREMSDEDFYKAEISRLRTTRDHLTLALEQANARVAGLREATLKEAEETLRGMADDCDRIGNLRRKDAFLHAADAIAALAQAAPLEQQI